MTPAIDRLAPRRRPDGPRAAFHRWRRLLFLHWEVPLAALRARVPPELEIDTFEGRAFVGLVPFTMGDIRLRFLPRWPGMTNFHETNVRTYVHVGGVPGVWFFSLDAASRQCVLGARATYHLPYHYASMRFVVTPAGRAARAYAADGEEASLGRSHEGDRHEVASTRAWPAPAPARCAVDWTVGRAIGPARPETLEDFLCERYALYARARGRLHRGFVHHAPYPLHEVAVHHVDQDLVAKAGLAIDGPPVSALYSPGVDVDVFGLERLRGP